MKTSPDQSVPRNPGGDERVKRLLHELPKVSAPWWFESEFRRRLWAVTGGKRPQRVIVPRYAIITVCLMVLGAFGYWLISPVSIEPASTPAGAERSGTQRNPVATPPAHGADRKDAEGTRSIPAITRPVDRQPVTPRSREGLNENDAQSPLSSVRRAIRGTAIKLTADSGLTGQKPASVPDSARGPRDTSLPAVDTSRHK